VTADVSVRTEGLGHPRDCELDDVGRVDEFTRGVPHET
jgi:hypothetical protein